MLCENYRETKSYDDLNGKKKQYRKNHRQMD